MKVGILLWDESGIDTDGAGLIEYGRAHGHEMSTFLLEDVSVRRSDGAAKVLFGGVDADRFDAVISRANLFGDHWHDALHDTSSWRDRVERLSIISRALGPRLFDSVETWLNVWSKFLMLHRLAEGGFPVPPFRSVTTMDEVAEALADWDGDVIIKPSYGLRGINVERVTDLAADRDLVEGLLKAHGTMMCQPFYSTQYGEYRISVAGETTPINMLKLPPAHTWRCKTYEGASWERIDPPDELIDLSIRATRHMGLTYAALDILPHPSGGWVILEVNAVPGFLNMFGEPGCTEGLAGIFDWVEKQLGSLSDRRGHDAEADHG
ncbi:ATP-grasp domain-containing protein [Streptomyces odontomachi]|uniref:ATP-grasp domain-containing protein n=1 Tax=Streptomyces odontomachi TaxID=2944940 RepID=UPI00210D6F5F|nr:hypothetical protein [Streptomyces sp. ODS25]